MTQFVMQNGDASQKRKLWLIDPIIDELMEEIGDIPEETLSLFWENIGHMFRYIHSGNLDDLPESVRSFAVQVEDIAHPEPRMMEDDEITLVEVVEGEIVP